MTPELSVVIPTHNRCALLARVLDAYNAQGGDAPFELVVADDGSSDGTAQLLRSYQSRRYRLRPLILEENRGPGQARNAALAAAGAPLVLIAGDDILPSKDFVSCHVRAHESLPGPNWAVLGLTRWSGDLHLNTLMRHIDGRGAQQFGYTRLRDGQEVDYRQFYTSNISFKRQILDNLSHWFDPDFTYAAYEDVELAYRLTQACGLRIRFHAGAHAGHCHLYGVRAFAERQYRCGLMAAVLLRKHPELRPRWRAGRLRRAARLASIPPVRGFLEGLSDGEVQQAEEAALTLGTGCEDLDVPVVDRVYLALLEHFVLKGMLVGELGPEGAVRPQRALLVFGLLHHLGSLLEGPGGYLLGDHSSRSALTEAAQRYDQVRRRWPWGLRWLALSPIREMILPPDH